MFRFWQSEDNFRLYGGYGAPKKQKERKMMKVIKENYNTVYFKARLYLFIKSDATIERFSIECRK